MDLLEARDRDAALYAMWSRNRISGMCTSLPVTGSVQRVYCGHTPTRETVQRKTHDRLDQRGVMA